MAISGMHVTLLAMVVSAGCLGLHRALARRAACLIADNDFFVRTDGGNGMQGQRCRFEQGFCCHNILFDDLNHCAQFFIEQCAYAGFVDVGLVGNQ